MGQYAIRDTAYRFGYAGATGEDRLYELKLDGIQGVHHIGDSRGYFTSKATRHVSALTLSLSRMRSPDL